MSFEDEIKKLIKNRKQGYQDIDACISDYGTENETVKEYNGRQLLELLQNADDAKSQQVLIKLDTQQNVLTISNKGKKCQSFDAKGVKSIMYASLSSKNSNQYIGNKGLGFRSIINWADEISILSNGVKLNFSQAIVKNYYEELTKPEEREEIQQERNLSDNAVPMAILAIPKMERATHQDWKTIISIQYKDNFLTDIEKQIEQIKAEVLLFLNHLEKISIDRDGDCEIIKKPTNKDWKIKKTSGKVPSKHLDENDKNKEYELKIAYNSQLENKGNDCLFSYFPTKININLPFIVHGTFELDSSRNQLIDNKKNKFIIKKLVNFIIKTALSLTQKEVNYQALQFLQYEYKNEVLKGLDFYKNIDNAIEEQEIYPCIDNKYRKKSDIVYSNDFAEFIQNNNFQDNITYLLKPTETQQELLEKLELYGFDKINQKNIKEVNKEIKNVYDRVDFINLLVENKFDGKLPLLIDENKDLIMESEVYTPPTQEFILPDYVKIKFMNKSFFDKLISKFQINSNEKARELKRKLKDITNIHSYEPAPVLQKIISKTNEEVKNNPDKKIEIIQKMVKSIYENYQKLGNLNIPTDTKIQLLNKQGELSGAKDLYLSKTYPSGKLTEFLFADVFADEDFLADISKFSFPNTHIEENTKLERFFISLGVSENTKFYDAKDDDKNYTDFVFEKIKKPENYRNNYLKIKGISKFDKIINSLLVEKIILWINSNNEIYSQLNDQENLDEFEYEKDGEYYNNWHKHKLNTKPSYIKYQLKKSNIFKDYLVKNESLGYLINDSLFNFDDKIFNNINKSKIESIMLEIGAVDKITDLSIEAISKVVLGLPKKAKNGKNTQSIYKLCIKHFEKNKHKLVNNDYKLFATKGNKKAYFSPNEIFYNGNIKLPKKITELKAIFNYPRRQNTQNVIDFFGINNLNSIIIKTTNTNELPDKTLEFEELFKQIKPYILACRIADIELEQGKIDELNKLKKINIKLCSEIKYEVDNQSYALEVNDYIMHDNNYLIKIDVNTSLKILKDSFEFHNSFADIIGLAFDISEVKNFRDMIGKDVSYIEKTIQNDIGNDIIIHAKEMLGIADEFNSFWRTIYQLKGYEYKESYDFPQIKRELGILTDEKIDYADLSSVRSCENIVKLFKELDLKSIKEFNKKAYYKIDSSGYHAEKLTNYFQDNIYNFKQCLHQYCQKNNKQEEYLILLNKYQAPNISDTKEQLEVDYQSEFDKFIKGKFDLKLEELNDCNIDLIYEKNKSKLGSDFEHIENNDNIRSLLYFENLMSKVERHIENEKEAEKQQEENNQLEHKNTKEIKSAKLTTPLPRQENINSGHQSSSHQQQDKQKKHAGHKAEEEVRTSLVKEYGEKNVTWVSRDKKGANHDFEYKDKNNKRWYVEVKTLSNNKFYISKNEKKFAEKHKDNYQIFLVGDQIKQISPVDFNSLKIEATDFVVYYQLTE